MICKAVKQYSSTIQESILWRNVIVCLFFIFVLWISTYTQSPSRNDNESEAVKSQLEWINIFLAGCILPCAINIIVDCFVRRAKTVYFRERMLLLLGAIGAAVALNASKQSSHFKQSLGFVITVLTMWYIGVWISVFVPSSPLNSKVETSLFALYCVGGTLSTLAIAKSNQQMQHIFCSFGLVLSIVQLLHFVLLLLYQYLRPKKGSLALSERNCLSLIFVFACAPLSVLSELSLTRAFPVYVAHQLIIVHFAVLAVGHLAFVQSYCVSESVPNLRTSSETISTDFIRYVSHQIRTPLHIASLGAELIHGESAPDGQIAALATQVQLALSEATDILQNLMDYESIRLGKLLVKRVGSIISINEICQKAIHSILSRVNDQASHAAHPELILFQSSIPDEQDSISIVSDEKLLLRAITNSIMGALQSINGNGTVLVSAAHDGRFVRLHITTTPFASKSAQLPQCESGQDFILVNFPKEFDFSLTHGAYCPEKDLGIFIANAFVHLIGGMYSARYVPNDTFGMQSASSKSLSSTSQSYKAKPTSIKKAPSIDMTCTLWIPSTVHHHNHSGFIRDVAVVPSDASSNSGKRLALSSRVHAETSANPIKNMVGLDSVPEELNDSQNSSVRSGLEGQQNGNSQQPILSVEQSQQHPQKVNDGNISSGQLLSRGLISAFSISRSFIPSLRTLASANSNNSDSSNPSQVSRTPSDKQRAEQPALTGRTWSSSALSMQSSRTLDSSSKDEGSNKFFSRWSNKRIGSIGSIHSNRYMASETEHSANDEASTLAAKLSRDTDAEVAAVAVANNELAGHIDDVVHHPSSVPVDIDKESNIFLRGGIINRNVNKKRLLVIATDAQERWLLCEQFYQLGTESIGTSSLSEAWEVLFPSPPLSAGAAAGTTEEAEAAEEFEFGYDINASRSNSLTLQSFSEDCSQVHPLKPRKHNPPMIGTSMSRTMYASESCVDMVVIGEQSIGRESSTSIAATLRQTGYQGHIIGLLNSMNDSLATELMANGCNTVFCKPFQLESIRRAFGSLIE